MCGIAGVFTNKNHGMDIEEASVKMRDSLIHRGPDDSGSFHWHDESCKIGLVHTRLSIIDLSSSAHQPMFNENSFLVLACNGEIYNYEELREELVKRGHIFKSRSDNEVILHLYEEKKESLLEDLRGMFAFAVWDKGKRRLFVARDRLGIKPLYYYWNGSTLIFASELRAIANSGLVKRELDNESLVLYLKSGSVPSPKTIYKDIFSLEPAHYLILQNQNLHKKRYWNLTDCFTKDKLNIKSQEEAISLAREELKDSIGRHLISDVPVGVFLSGGVDSSSLVSLVRKVSNNRIKTISAIFPDTEYDESRFAKRVANEFNTEHIEVKIPRKDLKSHIKKFLDSLDQPTVDGLNTYLVSWAVRNAGLKVCLSGLGGDEVFGGYDTFWRVPKIYHYLKFADFIKFPKYFLSLSSDNKINKLYDMFNPFFFEGVYLNYKAVFSNKEISQLLDKRSTNFPLTEYLSKDVSKVESFQEKISVLEMATYMANQLLKDSDVFGMHHSVEIRVPFVDHKLIACLANIPYKYKYQRKPNKHFLVKAINNLPQEIYRRRKRGFILPLDTWMRNELKEGIRESLTAPSIFNKSAVEVLLKNFYDNKIHWTRVWSLVALNKWLR